MAETWDIVTKDPYKEVASIIETWAQKNFYDYFVVSLVLDGDLTTELLCVNEFAGLYWDNDWWEGQKKIKMLGFIPLSNVVCLGEPKKNRRYCYVLTDPDREEATP